MALLFQLFPNPHIEGFHTNKERKVFLPIIFVYKGLVKCHSYEYMQNYYTW